MCSSQNKRIISSDIYVVIGRKIFDKIQNRYTHASQLLVGDNDWGNVFYSGILIPRTYQIPRTPTNKCYIANYSCVMRRILHKICRTTMD